MFRTALARAAAVALASLALFAFAGLRAPRAHADAVSDADANAAHDPGALPWQLGPQHLALGHAVQLDLPQGYRFLGLPQAADVMQRMGNLYNDNLLGIVTPSGGDNQYLVTLRYDEEGYVKDDEKLDADELLESIRSGEDEYNAERRKKGFPAIHAEGWQERPRYDKADHRVIWGLTIRDSEGASLNFNTRVLGRKGYVSVNLVTEPERLAQDKPAAAQILAGTAFSPGARYDDFDSRTDKVAEYGLTGLVLGGVGLGVAKLVKIGLLAKFGKLIIATLIAGKKAIVALLVGGAAAARRFFARKRSDQREV